MVLPEVLQTPSNIEAAILILLEGKQNEKQKSLQGRRQGNNRKLLCLLVKLCCSVCGAKLTRTSLANITGSRDLPCTLLQGR